MKGLVCVVDCEKVRENIRAFGKRVILMAKANCYGLGLRVAKAVENEVAAFGVAYGEEGIALRGLTRKPILLTTPWWDVRDVEAYDLTPSVHCVEDAKRLLGVRKPCAVHIKINSGMNRFGISSIAELEEVLRVLRTNPYLRVAGVYTHYASAAAYAEQNKSFAPYLARLSTEVLVHSQASSTCDRKGFDLLRVGLAAYRGSVHVYGRIIALRRVHRGDRVGYDGVYTAPQDQTVAIVTGGYADGIDKSFAGHLVYARGRMHPIVAVCMDVVLVAVSVPCAIGDEVTILGETPDPYGKSLYEVYTGLHGRCEYSYKGE